MLVDLIRFGHIIGIALGLGLAIYADSRFIRTLSAPVDRDELKLVREHHSYVIIAMGLLWATGIMLLYIRTGFDFEAFSPKLWVKVSVVSVLTINGFLIGHFAVPVLERALGLSFTDLPLLRRVQLALIGAVSAGCWVSLLALGVFQSFKTMALIEILDVLKWVFVGPLLGVVFVAVLYPTYLSLRRWFYRRRYGALYDWS